LAEKVTNLLEREIREALDGRRLFPGGERILL
jgi:hypothetical protein